MNFDNFVPPKVRGNIYQFAAIKYFRFKRRLVWMFGRNKYSRIEINTKDFPYSVIKHKSILLRQLKNIDMHLQYNKIENLKIAISCLNNIIIKPGETLSFWKQVGKPKKSKGYQEGLLLKNGTMSKAYGGGLCQLSNLIYWMILHTPLTIKERWHHSYDVFPDHNRTIPFACGATIFFNYIDLQIQNNTGLSFQLNLWLDDKYLNGEIKSEHQLRKKYEVYETDHRFISRWWGGYSRHNKIWKKITDSDTGKIETEPVTENNAIVMYNPLIDKNKST